MVIPPPAFLPLLDADVKSRGTVPVPTTYHKLIESIKEHGSRITLPVEDVRLFETNIPLEPNIRFFVAVGHVSLWCWGGMRIN